MAAKIFNIASHAVESVDKSVIDLSEPSIVQLQFGPEDVQSFDRVGTNLKITLLDGKVIVLEDFFVHAADGERSELVLIDDDGVMWWGQYGEQWNGFHFAEIEGDLVAAIPPWLWAGLGLLGAGAAAAALGGGGGDSDGGDGASNNPPVAAPDTNSGPAGDPISGNLLDNDSDPDGDPLTVTEFRVDTDNDGTPEIFKPGETAKIPGVGEITVGKDGDYTFTPDDGWDGDVPPVDYTTSDGNGGTDDSELNITVDNQPPNAVDDTDSGPQNEPVTGNVLGNDEQNANDADDDPIKVTQFSLDANGDGVAETYTPADGTITIDGIGTIAIDEQGNYTFDPIDGWDGTVPPITYTISDGDGGEDTAVLDITVTGQNDAPVIGESPVFGTVTEIADGEPDENSTTHEQSGHINFTDADSPTHTASVEPQGQNYVGDFTLTPGANDDGRVDWDFSVDDSAIDHLGAGETLTQKYDVTIDDGEGGTTTQTVIVTINGTNDQPEPVDDLSLMAADAADGSVTEDVLANDSDVDTNDTLTIVKVDGQAINTGDTITLSSGEGTVTLTSSGELKFTPAAGLTGDQVTIPYTVDDGSGATNAQSDANWVINIASVDIVDNDKPGADDDQPGNGDDVLASIDNLTGIAIGGQVPPDGSITSLTVTDGTGNTVTIDPSTVTVNTDGSFSTTADLSSLDDGTLTVDLTTQDSEGNNVTTQDTIDKDTVTEVTINPLTVDEIGQISTITGDGEPGSTIELKIDDGSGTPITTTVTVDNNGNWSWSPTTTLNPDEVTVTADATDPYGNTNTATRDVAGLTVEDKTPGDTTTDVIVNEDALSTGSNSASTTEQASSTFTVNTSEGDVTSITIGSTTISLADLQGATGTAPVDVTTTYGTLHITDYDSATGKVSFTYELTSNTTDHAAPATGASEDTITEDLTIKVVDNNGDTRFGSMTVGVVDDVPTAQDDAKVTLTEGAAEVSGNVIDNDTQGADGARVNEITYTNTSGDAVTVAIPDGGDKTVTTRDGTLTVHNDGQWEYTPNASVDHDKPANDTQENDYFSYTLIDGDGDVSNQATQPIVIKDTVPAIGTPDSGAVDEANLPLGSDSNSSQLEITGSLKLTAGQDSFDTQIDTSNLPALTSDGQTVNYDWDANTHTLVAYTGSDSAANHVFTVTLNNPTSASAGYTFTLEGDIDHGGDSSKDLTFDVTVTDSDGDTDSGSFTVTVSDDAASGNDAQTVDEDGTVTFNTTADATDSNTTISDQGDHGTATVNPNGTITYTPNGNYSGTDTITYETTADDGSTTTTTVTVTVNPVSDAPDLNGSDLGLEDNHAVSTDEDTAVALGLTTPVITDNTDQNGTDAGDNPERIGLITLSGLPEGAVLSDGTHSFTVGSDGKVTIKLSDVATETNATGEDLTLISTQYESLQVTPPEDSGDNFTVDVSVTSYEVDGSGVKLGSVPGATTTGSVDVNVNAVTDTPELSLQQPTNPGDVGAESLTVSGTTITAAINEDATLDLQTVLQEQLNDEAPGVDGDDTDGSESMWYTISGLPEGTQVTIGDVTYTADASGSIDTSANKITIGSTTVDPDFTITPPADYSNSTPINATITLNVQDSDGDSAVTPSVETVDVDLNLRVYAQADDVTLDNPSGTEDTPIDFLQSLGLTDTDGSEAITQIRITELPTEGGTWTLLDHNGNPVTIPPGGTSAAGGLLLTVGTGAGEYTLGEIKQFQLKAPGHSSLDGTMHVYVTTEEGSSNTQSGSAESHEWDHTLTVEVKPQAEIIDTPESDTDGDGNADLTMHGDESYSGSPGPEDQWFDLNSGGSVDLESGWTNQDDANLSSNLVTSEETFAQLTPVVVSNDLGNTSIAGAQFQWSDGTTTHTATYDGSTPIRVPVEYLDTLQFKAPPGMSGEFKIKVEAFTKDTDPDDGSVSTEVSGESWLTGIVIDPVADDATLAVNGHASGKEDTAIALDINPISSDPSETLDVTIDNIPVGAEITYQTPGGPVSFTATAGHTSVTISDFGTVTDLTIQPPENSNDDFTLQVTANTDDAGNNGPVTAPLDVNVQVTGVADTATITLPSSTPSYVEANLDNTSDTVDLKDLVSSVALADADGSEVWTVRVTGLPEGFALNGGVPVNGASATGADRVWVLSEAQFQSATIDVPDNYSGTVKFQVTPITTENDGDSLTGTPTDVSFEVTPSPEATVSDSATLTEDVASPLNLTVVPQNGDTDETLTAVRISEADLTGKDFTLYVDDGSGTLVELASVVTPSGGYYELTAAQAASLAAKGGANLDGTLDTLNFEYQITDTAADGTTGPETGAWQTGSLALTATPVTDAPDALIASIDTGSLTDGNADPNIVDLSQAGAVTVNLQVDSPDADGSEHLTRIVIDGVPTGVTVDGAEFLGGGQWLLIYDGAGAQAVGNSGLQVPVTFQVGGATGTVSTDITITAQVQDRGNQPDPGTSVESDSVTWHLDTNFSGGGGDNPATIVDWKDDPSFEATEDTPFSLSDMMDASVTINDLIVANTFTITLTKLPLGTIVDGMTHTVVNGVDVWSASTTVTDGDATDELQALMDSILITPAPDDNDNNASGSLQFNATLTTSVPGGGYNETATETTQAPIQPVTDPAVIDVQLDTDASGGDTSVETDQLDTADSSIPLTITVDNSADGTHGTIVNGKLYLQLSSAETDLNSGTLTVDGVTESLEAVNGIPGLTDGQYYVIDNVNQGDTLDLVYTPSGMVPGDVTVNAWVQNQESGSGVVELANGSTTLTVGLGNDGVTVTSDDPIGGAEAADNSSSSFIELSGLNVQLNDTTTTDGSTESIQSISLSGVPNGFLVYVGSSPATATLANNAGDDGSGNTWVLANGDLTDNVYILPPQHWSGTLSGLDVVVQSGESGLTESRVDTHTLADVTVDAVADGIVLNTTNTFGQQGEIIPLNLNASMNDSDDASVAGAADGSQETTTLAITGMGAGAEFFLNNTALDASQVSYDSGTDVYTITDLSQQNVFDLGFRQSQAALTDQEPGTVGTQIGVEAWTVEHNGGSGPADANDTSAHANTTITVGMTPQVASAGDDVLYWDGSALDGLDGNDTVKLQQGDAIFGADLGLLTNVESIDLGVPGANEIGSSGNGLTAQDVADILGSGPGDTLTILGDSGEDTVYLDSSQWSQADSNTWTSTVAGISVSVDVLDDDLTGPGPDVSAV